MELPPPVPPYVVQRHSPPPEVVGRNTFEVDGDTYMRMDRYRTFRRSRSLNATPEGYSRPRVCKRNVYKCCPGCDYEEMEPQHDYFRQIDQDQWQSAGSLQPGPKQPPPPPPLPELPTPVPAAETGHYSSLPPPIPFKPVNSPTEERASSSFGTVADRVGMFETHTLHRPDCIFGHKPSPPPYRHNTVQQPADRLPPTPEAPASYIRLVSQPSCNGSLPRPRAPTLQELLRAQRPDQNRLGQLEAERRPSFATINQTRSVLQVYKSAVDTEAKGTDDENETEVEVGTAFLRPPQQQQQQQQRCVVVNRKSDESVYVVPPATIRPVVPTPTKLTNHVTVVSVNGKEHGGNPGRATPPDADLEKEDMMLEIVNNKISLLLDNIDRQNKRIDSMRRAFDTNLPKVRQRPVQTAPIPRDSTYCSLDMLSGEEDNSEAEEEQQLMIMKKGKKKKHGSWRLMSCI